MNKAKLFANGRSQALRLPKAFRFDAREVYINRIDDAIVLFPIKNPWIVFEKSLSKFTGDYMSHRRQPQQADKRNAL